MLKIHVTLKVATTMDGKISTKVGQSQWITSPKARAIGHELRSQHQAILVGSGTVLADNPRLTARGKESLFSPIRVILDSYAKLPLSSACLENDGVPRIVFVGASCEDSKITAIQDLGVIVHQSETERPEVPWVCSTLIQSGIYSVLVEGGAQIHASFIKAQMADELVMFMAPKVFGGSQALSWCADLDCEDIDSAPQLQIIDFQHVEPDLMIRAKFI